MTMTTLLEDAGLAISTLQTIGVVSLQATVILAGASAALALVQRAIASGIFDPGQPLEIATLGSEHQAALDELAREIGPQGGQP